MADTNRELLRQALDEYEELIRQVEINGRLVSYQSDVLDRHRAKLETLRILAAAAHPRTPPRAGGEEG